MTYIEYTWYVFSYCDKISNVDLPSQLNHIGNYAFTGCSGLTKIDIPETVDYIGYGTFGPVDLKVSSDKYGYILNTPKKEWINFDVLGYLSNR